MSLINDSAACAIDAQEFTDFSEVISLLYSTPDITERCCRAIQVLDVTAGNVLKVTTAAGVVRTFTVSVGDMLYLQCASISSDTTCTRVRVYW